MSNLSDQDNLAVFKKLHLLFRAVALETQDEALLRGLEPMNFKGMEIDYEVFGNQPRVLVTTRSQPGPFGLATPVFECHNYSNYQSICIDNVTLIGFNGVETYWQVLSDMSLKQTPTKQSSRSRGDFSTITSLFLRDLLAVTDLTLGCRIDDALRAYAKSLEAAKGDK